MKSLIISLVLLCAFGLALTPSALADAPENRATFVVVQPLPISKGRPIYFQNGQTSAIRPDSGDYCTIKVIKFSQHLPLSALPEQFDPIGWLEFHHAVTGFIVSPTTASTVAFTSPTTGELMAFGGGDGKEIGKENSKSAISLDIKCNGQTYEQMKKNLVGPTFQISAEGYTAKDASDGVVYFSRTEK